MKTKKYKKKIQKPNINKRIKIIEIVLMLSFSIILFRILYLNIYMGSYYKMLLKQETSNIVYGSSAPRGRIYDRNMKLLVDNVAVKSIYYKKEKNITKKEEIALAYDLSSKLNLPYDNLYEINLKEFYIALYPDKVNKKITDEELEKLKNRKLTSNDIEKLKIERITAEDLSVFDEKDKHAAYLYYLMNKGYYYEEKEIKSKNVTDEEYAYISENAYKLHGFNTKLEWDRVYPYNDCLRGILGSVSTSASGIPYELKDYYLSKGYSLNDRVGISGLEKQYEDILKGEKVKYRINDDNTLTVIDEGKRGNDIVLTIDIDLQLDIDNMLKKEITKAKKEPNTEFYNRSFIVIQNPKTGEIMSMSGKQMIDNKIYDFSEGSIISTVTPGSVVKGASIIVGYNQKVINIGTTMMDECIKLYNLPEKCSWRRLGLINDLDAIKYSSNVYQYKIAMMVGGFNYAYNKELKVNLKAFDIYRNTFYQFGLGSKTGIDYPKEEDGYKGGSYAGDLLINFAIGQYDTYTPLQLSQYISTIANNGNRMKTHFLKSILGKDGKVLYEIKPVLLNKVQTEDKYLNRVVEGMKLVMSSGTGSAGFMGSAPNPAGKTGTSESYVDVNDDGIVDFESISNNFVGFAPANNPIMSIAVSSPDVQNPNRGSYKTDVNYYISKKASNLFFKYYNESGVRKI